jgi:hypothetical protein
MSYTVFIKPTVRPVDEAIVSQLIQNQLTDFKANSLAQEAQPITV